MGCRQIPAVAEQRKHPGWIVQLWVNKNKNFWTVGGNWEEARTHR